MTFLSKSNRKRTYDDENTKERGDEMGERAYYPSETELLARQAASLTDGEALVIGKPGCQIASDSLIGWWFSGLSITVM